ncbi:hypothetical protein ACOME3_000613 [Neoechinorhynchus agilis]
MVELFTRHISDANKFLCLVRIFDTFPDDESIPDDTIFSLIQILNQSLLDASTNDEVIHAIARCFDRLKAHGESKRSEIDSAIFGTMDTLTYEFNQAFRKSHGSRRLNSELRDTLYGPLLRLECFSRYHSYSRYDHWKKPIDLVNNPSIDPSIRLRALGLLVNSVLWSLCGFVENGVLATQNQDRQREYNELVFSKKTDILFGRVQSLIYQVIEPLFIPQNTKLELGMFAFSAIIDLLSVFDTRRILQRNEWTSSFDVVNYDPKMSELAAKMFDFACHLASTTKEQNASTTKSLVSIQGGREEDLRPMLNIRSTLLGLKKLLKRGIFPVGLSNTITVGKVIALYETSSNSCWTKRSKGAFKSVGIVVERISTLLNPVDHRLGLVELYKTVAHWHLYKKEVNETVFNALVAFDTLTPLVDIEDRKCVAHLLDSSKEPESRFVKHFDTLPSIQSHPGMTTSTPAPNKALAHLNIARSSSSLTRVTSDTNLSDGSVAIIAGQVNIPARSIGTESDKENAAKRVLDAIEYLRIDEF